MKETRWLVQIQMLGGIIAGQVIILVVALNLWPQQLHQSPWIIWAFLLVSWTVGLTVMYSLKTRP